MLELLNKTAVVTGAASGLGLAMARLFIREGMRVVLADLPGAALDTALQSLKVKAGNVVAMPTDVSDPDSVAALAAYVGSLGGVDLLCNNAGITGDLPRVSWEHDLANWRRVLDVNLMGVVHGLHSFVPLMIEQGREGHIVNTASMGGLMALPYLSPYAAAKSALIALSESLSLELSTLKADIAVSVLCPGMVATGMTGPGSDHPDCTAPAPGDAAVAFRQNTRNALQNATVTAEQVAAQLLIAIHEKRFYVLTHEHALELAGLRWQRLTRDCSPHYRNSQP
ncbi:MAG: putative oxidoreductase [Pseudomonas sp.]|jgi:NAD(P)-dependent dehydrogenase (short-subunit alcohol dehydrogenase family)|uniref:SDR family NAD(P)-dependent oxidoreductase n=1 Tax=Pseudomonas sp. TaxID=306 RepID=UPI002633DB70|nr:SDR family NAD(P)-dependent oxidoreductase [Pseudomonas sp.]MDB6052127.1 putative oxidoreductase [Pseudomonas sp.]